MNDVCMCDHVADEHAGETGPCLVLGCPCFAFEANDLEEDERADA